MITLAQADLGSLRADFIKSMVIALVAFGVFFSFAIGAVIAVLQYRMEKRNQEAQAKRDQETKPREIYPQPLVTSSAPKEFNAALADEQHKTIVERLDDHDSEFDSIWNALRAEDESTRKELREYVAETNLSLGRIEGALGTLPKENQS